MLVESWLHRAAAARPDHPALVTAQRTLTYAQLLDAAAAADLPAAPGDHVALALPPGAQAGRSAIGLGTLPVVPVLVAVDAVPGPAFVEELRRIWDRGDA
ncbi:MAG: hypothetical protein M3459_10315, partial [Actinomycetota bacterium]|nr:hypothetical protein [Actinomycetota bacterium]